LLSLSRGFVRWSSYLVPLPLGPSPSAAPTAQVSESGLAAVPAAETAKGSAPNATAPEATAQPQNSGSDEDEYDPETDLDVSEAPQVGVDVIARVLGGEIIDEREV